MREIISYILYNFNIIYVMFIYVEPAKDSNYFMREYDFFLPYALYVIIFRNL